MLFSIRVASAAHAKRLCSLTDVQVRAMCQADESAAVSPGRSEDTADPRTKPRGIAANRDPSDSPPSRLAEQIVAPAGKPPTTPHTGSSRPRINPLAST